MILYVLRYFPTLTETFVHDEIDGVAARGLPIEVAAFDPREGDTHVSVPVHTQPHRWRWLRALPALAWEWLRGPTRDLRVLWLTTIVRRAEHVHVHFAGEAAAWTRAACLRAGVPYSVTVHAVDLFKPRADLVDILRDARFVRTISSYNQDALRDLGVASTVIRCGVTPGDASPWLASGPRPPGGGTPVILAVGRDVPKKGLDTLVAAARILDRTATVRLVSDMPATPGVVTLGLLPRDGVARELAGATVFALPCRRAPDGDQDGIPVAILEAMAAGLPVVTTAVSGLPEIVDDAVGWVVPPDDPEALAEALRAALDDPAEAARRGAAGRARLAERGFLAVESHDAVAGLLRGVVGGAGPGYGAPRSRTT